MLIQKQQMIYVQQNTKRKICFVIMLEIIEIIENIPLSFGEMQSLKKMIRTEFMNCDNNRVFNFFLLFIFCALYSRLQYYDDDVVVWCIERVLYMSISCATPVYAT